MGRGRDIREGGISKLAALNDDVDEDEEASCTRSGDDAEVDMNVLKSGQDSCRSGGLRSELPNPSPSAAGKAVGGSGARLLGGRDNEGEDGEDAAGGSGFME